MMIEGKSIFFVDLPVALFAGVTVYGIHRSLFYGLLEWWFDSGLREELAKKGEAATYQHLNDTDAPLPMESGRPGTNRSQTNQ